MCNTEHQEININHMFEDVANNGSGEGKDYCLRWKGIFEKRRQNNAAVRGVFSTLSTAWL